MDGWLYCVGHIQPVEWSTNPSFTSRQTSSAGKRIVNVKSNGNEMNLSSDSRVMLNV
jgi:hypothetical protein